MEIRSTAHSVSVSYAKSPSSSESFADVFAFLLQYLRSDIPRQETDPLSETPIGGPKIIYESGFRTRGSIGILLPRQTTWRGKAPILITYLGLRALGSFTLLGEFPQFRIYFWRFLYIEVYTAGTNVLSDPTIKLWYYSYIRDFV